MVEGFHPDRRLSAGNPLPYVGTVTSQTRASVSAGLVIQPPYVAAPDLGIVAVDVAFGSIPRESDDGLALLCLGGHPARECVLDAESDGPSHEAIVAIDVSRPRSVDFVKRLRRYLDPTVRLRVVTPTRREAEIGGGHAHA